MLLGVLKQRVFNQDEEMLTFSWTEDFLSLCLTTVKECNYETLN